jgi:outer membrane protein assembly factor BamB
MAHTLPEGRESMDVNRIDGSLPPAFAALHQKIDGAKKDDLQAQPREDSGDQLAPREQQPLIYHASGISSIDMSKAAQVLAETKTLLWEFEHHGEMVQDPVVADGAVYMSAYTDIIGKTLFAIDAESGQKMWEVKEKARTTGFAIENGTCYYGSEEQKKFFALDAKTGKKIWEFQAPDGFVSEPVIHDGVVYAGDYNRNFHALDGKTGEELWSIKTRGVVTGKPIIADGTIFVGCHGKCDTDDGTIYAIAAKRSGIKGLLTRVQWKCSPKGYHGMEVAVGNGTLYASMRQGDIVAFDSETGRERWKSKPWDKEQELVVHPSPLIVGDTLYSARVSGKAFALNAKTGEKTWESNLGGMSYRAPQEENGIIYFGYDGRIRAFDGATKKEVATYSAPSKYHPTLAIDGERLYIGGSGKLTATLVPGASPGVSHVLKDSEEQPEQDKATVEHFDDMLSVDGIKLQVRHEAE